MEPHGPRDTLELHGSDLREGGDSSLRGCQHLLAHEHLAGSSVLGDPRGNIHRLTKVVTILEEDGSRVEAHVRGRQARLADAVHHVEGGNNAWSRVLEEEHDPVSQPFDGSTAVLDRCPLHESGELLGKLSRSGIALFLGKARITADVQEAHRRRSVQPAI